MVHGTGRLGADREVHYVYDGNRVIQERDTNNAPTLTLSRLGPQLLARSDNRLRRAITSIAARHRLIPTRRTLLLSVFPRYHLRYMLRTFLSS